jgi:hypothetical protein
MVGRSDGREEWRSEDTMKVSSILRRATITTKDVLKLHRVLARFKQCHGPGNLPRNETTPRRKRDYSDQQDAVITFDFV